MSKVVKNILFIMCDQLRFDYLSCAGHPHLHTPNVDWLAEHGVRFTNAYCQSPVCGPSRMSFYTGRYMQSHGATWNKFPLNVSEWTLGDYMRQLNVKTGLVGKTHMQADTEGMARLGIDPESVIGVRVAECGFDPYDRHDGLHCEGPNGRYDPVPPQYEKYLHDHGYDSDNPGKTGPIQPKTTKVKFSPAGFEVRSTADACEGRALRDGLHHRPRDGLHP